MAPTPLPKTIMGYVLRTSGRHQIGLAVLAAGVFGLTSVPLEIQRRIVNDAIKNGATQTIVWLALAFAGVALLEQAFKLGLNIYRGWVSEDAVRTLRKTLRQSGLREPAHRDVAREARSEASTDDDSETGTHAAMVVSEAEPIGGFVGMAISEPLLQAGILASVIGYMTWLEPWTLVLSAAFLLPQALFVPPLQRAINRRAGERIKTLRHLSGDIVDTGTPAEEHIQRVFTLIVVGHSRGEDFLSAMIFRRVVVLKSFFECFENETSTSAIAIPRTKCGSASTHQLDQHCSRGLTCRRACSGSRRLRRRRPSPPALLRGGAAPPGARGTRARTAR